MKIKPTEEEEGKRARSSIEAAASFDESRPSYTTGSLN